ncbi:MAG: sigma 54-interacting transcriptional regulator [Archangiaceae bacterium]|nr:sigma 54-interacting transcriptional regulator [Archangiaceae bacterium]
MSTLALDATLTVVRKGALQAAQFPDAVVCVAAPAGERTSVPLGLSVLTVGSSPECDLKTSDPSVSRAHCSVALTSQGLVLKDLGSKNGTFIGSVRVREAVLPLGVRARLGETELWVESTGMTAELPFSADARFGDVRGASVVMRALFAQLEKAARTDEPVLLEGESGTGKELLARALHRASARAGQPLVVVECAALSPQLVEAELFGFVEGAFTGARESRVGLLEQANGGTLLLDEVGDLPLDLQTRFLRALETRVVRPLGSTEARPIDVRIVSTTQRDIRSKLHQGQFRSDLFYRLAVLQLRVPPLRERGDDVLLLVEDVLAQRDPPAELGMLPPGTLELFRAHQWPGNVRELRNAVARLFVGDDARGVLSAPDPKAAKWSGLSLGEARAAVVAQFERQYIESALAAHGGNVTSTAKSLGVTRQTVHRLLRRDREDEGTGG